jgi:hypothetical protein
VGVSLNGKDGDIICETRHVIAGELLEMGYKLVIIDVTEAFDLLDGVAVIFDGRI